jgi:hypothetical protein
MRALERDPEWRWQSAAELRDAIERVIEQPGNRVSNAHVIEWVDWLFTQKPGDEASGLSKLAAMTSQSPQPTDLTVVDVPREPQLTWLESDKLLWVVLAYTGIVAVGTVWRIVALLL